MPFATNDGTELYYDVEGPTDGEAIVLVEGLSYGTWMWDWQRPALTDPYRTIVWDNRGTGESDTPAGPYTTEQMAGDLDAVLEDAGVDTAHVVGASLGGMVAQQYALDFDRARSLALVCTSPGGEEAVPIPEDTQARMLDVPAEYDEAERIRYKMKPAFTEEFWAENPDLVDRIVDWRLETDPSDDAYEWQAAAAVAFDVSDRLADVNCPSLVLHGTDDLVVPFENGTMLSEKLPEARFEPVDGGSHLFFIERPGVVNDHLTEFLADV